MSLLSVRRDRRALGGGAKKPPSVFRLVLLLILVVGLIWYLGRLL